MVRTQIQLTEEQARRLAALAAKRGVSRAALIRKSVEKMLVAERVSDDAVLRRKAIAAAGALHSGTGDLSARHDEYAAEAFAE
ncbi:MAG: ribbon-helix-helix protein, CopG family [Armatimonadetes bacterium]|nr:ribbon-helix-helix protein, CopG family [Armatimonadota bacterium]